jgi:hypothetical protein
VVLLVAREWTAAITGNRVVLFLDFSLRRKFLGTIFPGGNGCSHDDCFGSKEKKTNFVGVPFPVSAGMVLHN